MTKRYKPDEFAHLGISLVESNGQRAQWMPYKDELEDSAKGTIKIVLDQKQITMDSGLTVNNYGGTAMTPANIGLPVNLLNYIDPNIIEVQFSAMNADKLLPNKKVADWTMEYATFTVKENTGSVGPYSDYTNNILSDVNYSFPVRQIFKYQTGYQYGTFELERSALARIQLASERQSSAAYIMGKTENAIYLRGVNGVKLYGFLNDPNVAEPITPTSVTTSQGAGKTSWADKAVDAAAGANFIYNDIMKLWQELVKNNGGLITNTTPITLAMSHNTYRFMSTANNYNVAVEDLVKRVIPNITIVTVPELSLAEGERLYMICPDLNGQQAGFLGFSDKLRVMPIIQHMGYFEGKMCAATFGCVITQPSLIACMSGV